MYSIDHLFLTSLFRCGDERDNVKKYCTYLFKDRFLNPKSLKLNGLVLGEEVGSDCQDEIPQDLYDA